MSGIGYVMTVILIVLGVFLAFSFIQNKRLNREMLELENRHSRELNFVDSVQKNNDYLKSVKMEMQSYEADLKNMIAKRQNDMETEAKSMASMTGNTFADSILLDKKMEAEREGIAFETELEGLSVIPLSDVDSISLMENILSNAIQACRDSRKKEPHIYLSIRNMEPSHGLAIKCENTKSEKQHPIEDKFATTKQERSIHGNGTKVIRDIVERYDGHLQYEDNGDTFCVTIQIPASVEMGEERAI